MKTPTQPVCRTCGDTLRNHCVARIYRPMRSPILFCNDAHAAMWDKTMEADIIRLNHLVYTLGQIYARAINNTLTKLRGILRRK